MTFLFSFMIDDDSNFLFLSHGSYVLFLYANVRIKINKNRTLKTQKHYS